MTNEMAFGTYHEVIAAELRAALRRYFDTWEGILDKEEPERAHYISTIEQHRLPIVVLSCILLESAINFYLSTKCNSDVFGKKEKNSLREKWTVVPKLFVPKFEFPAKTQLEDDLVSVIDRRNRIVHSKPMLSIDGDNWHEGNEPSYELDEHELIGQCATLPFRLIEHFLKFDPGAFGELSNIRTCSGAVAHEFEAGQNRIEVAAQYPRELIREIMQRGHNRRTAISCAVVIGNKPKTDELGNIVVRLGGKEILLKPLKFFSAD